MANVLFALRNGIESRIFCSERVAMLYSPLAARSVVQVLFEDESTSTKERGEIRMREEHKREERRKGEQRVLKDQRSKQISISFRDRRSTTRRTAFFDRRRGIILL